MPVTYGCSIVALFSKNESLAYYRLDTLLVSQWLVSMFSQPSFQEWLQILFSVTKVNVYGLVQQVSTAHMLLLLLLGGHHHSTERSMTVENILDVLKMLIDCLMQPVDCVVSMLRFVFIEGWHLLLSNYGLVLFNVFTDDSVTDWVLRHIVGLWYDSSSSLSSFFIIIYLLF